MQRRKRQLRTATALCALALALAACSSGPRDAPALLDQLDQQGRLTGAVLISRGGTVLLSRAYGLADEQQQLANTPQTRFRIGSNTKQFTAMAILLLQDQGLLSVQDSICRTLAPCPAAWQQVTLFHLLTHSSGIPDYTNFDDFPSLIGTAATPRALIDRFRDAPLLFTPGARWSYSNSGYVLLGAVIEQLSHVSYAQFLADNIFAPLGLADTGYDTSELRSGHAQGYLSPQVKPVFLDMSEFYAAGALYSTVGDLQRWDEALIGGRLASRGALEAMMTPQVPCPGGCALSTDLGYGFGFFIGAPASDPYVYHWGRIDGFQSSNGLYRRADVTVVMLSNLETVATFDISTQLAALVLER